VIEGDLPEKVWLYDKSHNSRRSSLHANAKLTPAGRRLLVARIASGRPVAHVAAEMGVARNTADKWWRRWLAEGAAGLEDRCSRPHRSPRRVARQAERRIESLRRREKLGPARIAHRLGMAASTVYRVLRRLGLNRLSSLDRPTGRVIRRYEHECPGDLVHMDVKKLGRIPPGGGWRIHGRGRDGHGGHSRVGYAFVHAVVDDHSRLAYCEVLGDEQAGTVAAFWGRALAWFRERGVDVRAVLTDNGSAYRSRLFGELCAAAGIRPRRTRPYRPQTNGKVERFNRTLLDEWAYVRTYRSEAQRVAALEPWLHQYNHHRGHAALGGLPPVARVTNLPRHHS
jgi:transposase InsO family protein